MTIRHVAIYASDLDKSIKFYCDMLDFALVGRNREIHNGALESFKDYLFEASEDLEWAKLEHPTSGAILELIHCNKPVKVSELNHIAFTVENIDELVKKINPMLKARVNGKVKLFFFRDYDDNLIELVEDLYL